MKRMRPVLLLGLIACRADQPAVQDESGFQEDSLRQILVQHSDLFDPFSVQFRKTQHRDGMWCGELNAKNRMGAYRGWASFYVSHRHSINSATIWVASDEESSFPHDSTVASACRWAAPERAAFYDSLNSTEARRAREAAALQRLYEDSLRLLQRMRAQAREDSLRMLRLLAYDKPGQIRYCAAAVGRDGSIPRCLMNEFGWSEGAAETYWQYERQ